MKNRINKIILFLTIILVVGFVFATASFAADTWSSKWTSSTPYATGASTGAGKISNNDKPTDYNSWKNGGTTLSRERLNYYRAIGGEDTEDENSDYTISQYKYDIAKANGAPYPKDGYRGEDYIETDSGERLYVWKAAAYTAGYNMDMGNQGDVSGKTLLAINDGTRGTGSTVTSGKMLLFLHRTPFYMTVFENSRTRWMYSEETGYKVNGITVKTEETMPASMVEGRTNGIKGITSVMEELSRKMLPYVVNTYTMSYSPVPHVLGTEGTSAYSSVAGDSLYDGKYMAIALMDETNEQPVPVLIPVAGDNNTSVSNLTPFWSFQGENLTESQNTYIGKNILQSDGNYWVFQDGMTENGAKIQPYVKLDDIIQADLYASGKTNVYPSGMVHVANNIKDSYNAVEHSFKLPYASENLVRDGVKEQDIGLGYRNYLEEAIVQMKYPFLVSSVSLALDETITQRNSSVQFMSAIISNYTARAVVDSGIYDWGQTYNFADKNNGTRRYIAGGFASYTKNGQVKNTNDNLFAGKDRNKKFNGRAILFRFAEDSINGTDIYTPLVVAQSVGDESAYENSGKGINFKTSGLTFIRSFGQRKAQRNGDGVKTLDIHYIRMPMKVFSRSIVTEPVYTTINGVKYPAFRNIYRDKENGSTDATGFTYGFHSFYSLGRYGDGYEGVVSRALSAGSEITNKIIEKTVPSSGMSTGTYSSVTNNSADSTGSRVTAWSYQKNDDFGTWRGVGFTPSGLDTYSSFPGETTNYDFATSGFANMNGIIRYPWSDRGNKRSGYYYNKIYLENVYGKINNIDIIQSSGNTLLAGLNRNEGNAEEIIDSVSDAVIRTFEDKVSNDPTVVLSIRDMVNSSNGTKTGQKDFNNASGTGFTSRAYDIDMGIYNSFEKEYCKALTMEKVGSDVQSDANFIVEDNAKFGRIRYSKKCQNDAPLSSGSINLMNGYYTDSYSALLEAWDKPTTKYSNISYKEYLAYIYFQYFSIEQLSSDYAWGRTMRYKGSSSQDATSNINTTKTYYSNGTIYRGQFANIWLLNEEDRLNNKLQYGKDSSGKSIYFSDVMKNNLADHSDNVAEGVHVVVPSSADENLENITDYDLKSKFGPELFLVDNVSGNYSTGNKTLSCEPGYTKNGDVCTAIFKAARNPVCEKDFKYNEALGLCIRVDKTPMQCPAYYTLFNGFCVRYNGTEEICRDGEHYDSNMKACIIYKDGRCDAGWTPDVSNGTCVRIIEKSCPFGGELINDRCVVKRGEYKGTFQNKETLDFDTSAIGKSLTLNPGRYLLEAWGAQGGGAQGGKGGYSSGVIEIKETTTIYINVGSSGASANATKNGGGTSTVAYGGGASDIRIGSNDLNKRVLVAGGGGGSITVNGNIYAGGYAGGWIASDGNSGAEDAQIAGSGASISGGIAGYNGTDGDFGHGGNCNGTNCAGGGGGYYGGGAGFSGGGGTGFAWADNTNHYAQNTLDEKYKLTKAVVNDGDSSFVDFEGNEVVGNSGNGHVRISSFENAQYTCEHVALLDGEKVELESSYIGQSYEFDNKGHCEIWYAPVSGRYLLETWGASGGESFYHGVGGKGGYSAGYVDLNQGDPLNVCVGGAGAVGANGAQKNLGGFNGGGSTTGFGGAGGGMTSISTSKSVKDSIIVAGGGGGGGRGSNYSEEILDDSVRTTMRDDYNGYDSVVYLKADKGQRVQIVIGKYFAEGSANVPYEIAYYSSDPSSIVNSQSGSGWFNKFESTFEKLYSGYYLLSDVPNRWSSNFNNLVELTTFTAPYDGYYIAYTHYRPGSTGRDFDSVLGVKVYTVLTHTDDSGNAGAGGGVNGMNSAKGVEVDISGYGGTASKNAGTGTGGDSDVGGAGGGGWYGGNGATFQGGGGGGSGYIKSGTIINGITVDGTKSFKTTKSTSASMSYETGHFGDGHAKITLYSGEDFNGDVLTGSTKGTLSGTSNVGLWVVPDRTKTINFCKVTSPYDRTEIDDSYFENIYYKNFGFTGSTQTVTLEPGQYIVEAWGAQGGSTDGYDNGGKGGYVSGTLNVSKTTTYTIVVGGKGGNPTVNGGRGGFGAGGSGGGAWTNGATSSASVGGGGGGGLSGIFNGTESIIVAGGGGGGAGKYAGGYGGGGNGTGLVDSVGGKGGLADSANTSGKYVTSVSGGYNTNKHPTYGQIGGKLYGGAAESGNFEEAQAGNSTTFAGGIPRSSEYSYANGMLGSGGGGGGYYGGNGGNGGSLNRTDAWGGSGGGGSNYTGAVAGGTSKNGSETFISPAGGNETGHTGNGAVRIRGTRFVDAGTNYIKEFSYTGQTEVITLKPGTYKFQVWGAQGGGTNGGKGGYSEGQMVIKEDTTMYINVGGKGADAYAAGSGGSTTNNLGGAGGFNGGGGGSNGYSTYTGGSGGGGASDIRIGQNSLYARVIVAGGGGGMGGNSTLAAGYGGGETSGVGYGVNGRNSSEANQITGNAFGVGGGGRGTGNNTNGRYGNGGGGGGWFGGRSLAVHGENTDASASGGSGFVFTADTVDSTNSRYTGGTWLLTNKYYLLGAKTTAGNVSFESPTGANEVGHSGNGYIRISGVTTNDSMDEVGTVKGFSYTGDVQAVTLKKGLYKLEAWGAQGGDGRMEDTDTVVAGTGGKGGYTTATFEVTDKMKTVYVYVGGKGGTATSARYTYGKGGWNGGGIGGTELSSNEAIVENGAGGGGMTHFTLSNSDKLVQDAVIKGISGRTLLSPAEFVYSGNTESITLGPGTYQLEVWGAQGGSYTKNGTNYVGGRGGYTTATITLQSETTLYVSVGQEGQSTLSGTYTTSAFNGGGVGSRNPSSSNYTSGGGGATHIAFVSGQLKDLSNNKNNVIVVAGGGGGAGGVRYGSYTGGAGGGETGGNGAGSYYGDGGTQTSGGQCRFSNGTFGTAGAFGVGGNGTYIRENDVNAAGGGGGWYGGAGAAAGGAGGGGSGYSNTNYVSNASMSSGIRDGNGYAKITQISTLTDNTNNFINGEKTDFRYTGKAESVMLSPGVYKFETWGAQGGTDPAQSSEGGKGGYSSGTMTITEPTLIYVSVGGMGGNSNMNKSSWRSTGGGGGTDFSMSWDGSMTQWNNSKHLYSRFLVAGGGGGMHGSSGGSATVYDNGGTNSRAAATFNVISGQHGSGTWQSATISGPGIATYNCGTTTGAFGYAISHGHTNNTSYGGWNGGSSGMDSWASGGAGGGWYGGAADWPNGSGGSGYAWTSVYSGYYPSGNLLSTKYYLQDVVLKNGNESFASPNGTTETGHSGDGYARITKMSGGNNGIKMEVTIHHSFDTDKVLIVAGGGGGASGSLNKDGSRGGNGGGVSGSSTNVYTSGGTQTGGGTYRGVGDIGYSHTEWLGYGSTGGGGGGWYGGKLVSNPTNSTAYGGAGGSGYINANRVTGGSTAAGVREGNGYAQITVLQPPADYTIDKSKYYYDVRAKYDKTCEFGYEETVDGMCRKIENIKCDTGYSWNAPKAKCEFYESPIGCTSEGKIITSTSGNRKQWACGYTQNTTCPDGYKKDGGLCVSTKNATANPDVCPSGYTDKGTYCERVISKSLKVGSVTGDIEKASALTGKDLVVELGQVYSFRNYVGYNASLSRAYANKKGNMTSSIFFPQVSTNVWLFNTKFGTTGCERRGEENCDITAENSAIQIPITVSDTKIFNGNKPYLGSNTASSGFSQEAMKYIQNNPDVVLATYPRQVNINEDTGKKTVQAYLASHLFAYYYRFNAYGTGGAEFQDRYALVEFVFKVDTDGIYVLNRDGDGTLPLDTTSGTSSVIDWSKAKVIKYSDIVKDLTDNQIKNFLEVKDNPDGTKTYSLKTRNEKGEQQINSIAFVSSIDSLSPVGTQNAGMLQEVQGMGAQNLSEEKKRYMMMDNGITSDDTSALVADFKAAIGDVYIDRVEIVDDNGNIIKTYDAMIEGRCTNPVDDGYTEAFAGKTYEELSNMKPEDAIGCVEVMNPTTNKVPNLRLFNTNNYEVRIYTKYIDKNEVKVDPNVKEVNLEIIHSADGGSKSIAQYLTSKGQQDDVMYIASGKEDRTNIIHDQTAKFAYSMGWLPGKTDKYTVSGTLKDITVESLESNYKNAGSQDWANNAQPLLIPLKAIANSNQGGISTGNYTAKIGTASNSINKEKIWDEIVFSYNTGDAPDNKVYFEIECLKKDGTWGQLTEQDGTCLMVSSNVYTSKCKVYAIVERNKPDGVDTTTRIKWNSGNSPTTVLEAGTLKNGGNQLDDGKGIITNIGDKEKIFLEEIALPLKNLYYSAYVEHYSEYNNFTDVNPADNYDNVCINYNKVNYKVANLTATITGGGNTDSTIYQISDKDSKNKTTVTVKGVFDIEKIFETADLDKRDIKTEVIFEHPTDASAVTGTGGGACKVQVTNNSSSAGHVGVLKTENFSKSGIPYEMTCVIDNSKIKAGSELKVTVKINGGKTATGKEFDESNYSDNEAYTRIQTNQAGDHKPIICKEDKCVQQNKWDILFDFVYRYDSKVESYKTNQNVYMKWTDYAVPKWGTDKTYASPITSGVGNELRYPKDYMAFFSDKTDYTQLCTDYRNGNGECWRYEMNTRHTVEYYKKSTAVTSLYTTLKTLPYSNGAGTALAGPACSDKNRSDFGAAGTAAVDKMGGNAGRTSHWAETVSTDRNKNICHGYNDATEYSAPSSRCEYVVDWWGNDICIAEENQFDEDATTAKHPNDYINYAYFGTASGKNSGNATNTAGGSSVGYILNDGNGLGRSDTTKTIRIVLQNTTSQGKENQGKEGTVANGWIYTRKMDVCTDYAYSDIKYHCDTFFQYGTYGNRRYFKQTTKNGNGVCYEAKYDEGERTCEWTNTSQTPPETTWWNDSGATCYRQHADYTCSVYHGVSASEPTIDNNKTKGNEASGICKWSVSVHPTVENETWISESDSDSDSASSSSYDCHCHKCGCDSSGNNCDTCCDTCYTTERAHCRASVTCGSDPDSCTASGGSSCSVSCSITASYVNYRLRWSHSGWNDETREYDHKCSVSRPDKTFARQQEAETGGTSTSYDTPTDSGSFADINDFSVNYMTRTCVGHDVEDYGGRNGGYCYETYVDADKGKENLTQKSTPINGSSAERGDFDGQDTATGGVGKMMCIRWKSVEYKEIKYVTTASPKDTFVSRNYDTEAKISQWRCSSKTPSKYPDVAVAMRYEETFTSTMYISTNRTGGEWVELKKDENGKPQIDRDILPRNGEYMGVKVVSQYKTTRGTKPGEMPYLTGFYNNYHNIVSGDNDHEIKAPTNYTHFNYNDAVFAESVATTNYGYCNARVAEPYGCEMNQYANQRYTYTQDNYANTNTVSRNTQFAVPADGTAGVDGSIDHTQIQGNDNLDWRSENAGMSGVCYFGPDDKYKWATGNLNTNLDIYYADGSKVTETASLDGKEFGTVQQVQGQIALTSKGADGKEERRFYPLVGVGKCNLKVAALCVDYSVEWTLPMSDQADGTSTNKIYFDIDNSYEGVTLDFANKPFYGVGKYEELLLGTRGGDAAWGNSVNNLSGLSKGKYFNNVDGNILPLCACQSVTIPPVGEVGWGTTEWEIS